MTSTVRVIYWQCEKATDHEYRALIAERNIEGYLPVEDQDGCRRIRMRTSPWHRSEQCIEVEVQNYLRIFISGSAITFAWMVMR